MGGRVAWGGERREGGGNLRMNEQKGEGGEGGGGGGGGMYLFTVS